MHARLAALLLTLPLLLPACHQRRPADATATAGRAPTAAATPAPTPYPEPVLDAAGLDIGPTDAWYARNSGRIQLDPAGAAEDLALVVNLIQWVVEDSESAWSRAAPRIDQAIQEGQGPLRLPVAAVNVEEAKRYHAAAAPLSQKAEAERDPRAEEAYYRKAVVLSPGDADLWNHLAITSSLQKKYAHAERFARTAIAVDPTFLSAYQELSYAYKNSERYADAVAIAERGLKVDGDLHTKAVLLARQGQAWWMLGEKDLALGAFTRSRRLGGPAWIESYLEGKQEIGKSWKPDPAAAPGAAASPTPAPTPAPAPPAN